MIQDRLFSIFPANLRIPGQILLVPPHEFHKLKGISLGKNHLLILVRTGHLSLSLNGETHEMSASSFLDLLEIVDVQIEWFSPDLRAWCLFVSFSFASESMKNLKIIPQKQLMKWLHIPIRTFSKDDCDLLERQLQMLAESLDKMDHHYQQEMVQLYFKGFSMELGNILFALEEKNQENNTYFNKRDFIVVRFMELVSKHFMIEHNILFYANSLCVSPKHLTRILREMLGRTPHEIICDELTRRAMAMLEDDKIPVRQIAEELHFSDQASFCKFFKKQMGIPPMDYRKKIKCLNAPGPRR